MYAIVGRKRLVIVGDVEVQPLEVEASYGPCSAVLRRGLVRWD
jgi:hypothetical protein